METKQFAVIGGDKRNIYLSGLLKKSGMSVRMFGFDKFGLEKIAESYNLYEAIDGADYIIGPTPLVCNNLSLNAIYSSRDILADDLFRLIKPTQIFFGGHIKEEVFAIAEKYAVNCVDMLKWEELALLNAIPTAEGAIKIAMENTEFTLHGARVMIVGFGRIGKLLCKMLMGIGASVHPVVLERHEAAAAKSFGYSPIMYEKMDARISGMDVIFNTVPEILFDRHNIKHISKDCLFVDVSSVPHGINSRFAKEAGIKVLFAGSLPGAVAPKSAAKYIQESIYHYLDELKGGG